MHQYKKVFYDLTMSNLRTRRIEASLNEIYDILEEHAKEGWRFVQMIHPYSTHTLCMLIFERDEKLEE